MSNLSVIEYQGTFVVDSRLIAEELGIEHRALMQTIKKYLTEIQEFGHLTFENESVTNSVGARNTVVFCYLNEDQATYLMTLSKNTDKVRQCKRFLVKAFRDAKEVIKTVIPRQNDELEKLRLQNENLRLQMEINQLDNTMIALHGKQTVLALRGMSDQIVEVEKLVTEVVNPQTGTSDRILTADQLKTEVKRRVGQKIPSQKWFVDKIRQSGRDDLLKPVTRSRTDEYVDPDRIDEAIAIVFGSNRQMLLGET